MTKSDIFYVEKKAKKPPDKGIEPLTLRLKV